MVWNTLQASVRLYDTINDSITFLSGQTVDFNLYGSGNNITYHATAVTNTAGTASVGNNVANFSATTVIDKINTNGRLDEGASESPISVSSIDATKWSIHTAYNGIEKSTDYIDLTSARTQTQIIIFEKNEDPPKTVYLNIVNIEIYIKKIAVSGAAVFVWPAQRTISGGYSIGSGTYASGYTDSTGAIRFEFPDSYSAVSVAFSVYYESNGVRYQEWHEAYDNAIYVTGNSCYRGLDISQSTNGWFSDITVICVEGVMHTPLPNNDVYIYARVNNDEALVASGNTSTEGQTNRFTGGFENVEDFEVKVAVHNNTYNIDSVKYINFYGAMATNKYIYFYLYLPDYTVTLPKVLDTTYLDGYFNLPNTFVQLYDEEYENLISSGYTTVGSASTITLEDYTGDPYILELSKNHYNTTVRKVCISATTDDSRELFFTKLENCQVLTHMTITRKPQVCMVKQDLDDYVKAFYTRNMVTNPNTFLPTINKVGASMSSFYDECTDMIGFSPVPNSIEQFKSRFTNALYDVDTVTAIRTKYIKGPGTDEQNEERFDYTYDSNHCYVHNRSFIPVLDTGPYLTFQLDEYDAYTVISENEQPAERSGGGGAVINPYNNKGYVVLDKVGTPYNAVIQYRYVDLDNISHYMSNNDWDWQIYTYGTEMILTGGRLLQFRRLPVMSQVSFDKRFSKSDSDYYYFKTSGSKLNVFGYIMTLLDSSNTTNSLMFLDSNSGSTNYTFYKLFFECDNIDTEYLHLNATTLSPYCFKDMFMNCTGIEHAPIMRENESYAYSYLLAHNCCSRMFYNCSSMKTFPIFYPSNAWFPENCFETMFKNCENLENDEGSYYQILLSEPSGNAVIPHFGSGCCASMFTNCKKIKRVFGDFDGNTTYEIGRYSFNEAFLNCENLITAPYFYNISNIDVCGCRQMFCNCSKLKSDFSFNTVNTCSLADNACQEMFKNCKLLEKSFQFYASDLGVSSYAHCFDNAGSPGHLFSVSLFNNVVSTASNYTYSYMFYQAYISNIPYISAIEIPDYACEYMFSESNLSNVMGLFTNNLETVGAYGCQHMFDGCQSLNFELANRDARSGTDTDSETYYYYLASDFNYININATHLGKYCYAYMFANSSINNLTSWYFKYSTKYRKPSITVTYASGNTTYEITHYTGYYDNSTLVTHINLPATSLSVGSYYHMFDGCNRLSYAVSINNVTSLDKYSCAGMFMNCNFTSISPCIPKIYMKAGHFYTNWLTTLSDDVLAFQTFGDMRAAFKLYDLERGSNYYNTELVGIGTNKAIKYSFPTESNGSTDQYDYVTTSHYNNTRYRMRVVRDDGNPRVNYYAHVKQVSNGNDNYKVIFPSGVTFGHYKIQNANVLKTNITLNSTTKEGCYYQMFANNASLVNAFPLFIYNNGQQALAKSCCEKMFEDCTALKYPPRFDDVAVRTAGEACYRQMFNKCKSLIFPLINSTSNALHANTLGVQSYLGMYAYCHKLESAPTLSCATTLNTKSCYAMFAYCNSLRSHPVLKPQTLQSECYGYMFTNACAWYCKLVGRIHHDYIWLNEATAYTSYDSIPYEFRSTNRYVKITPDTTMIKIRFNVSDTTSVNYGFDDNIDTTWYQRGIQAYNFPSTGVFYTYRTGNSYSASTYENFSVTSNYSVRNAFDGYRSVLSRFCNADFKTSINSSDQRYVNKVILQQSGNNWYMRIVTAASPTVATSNVIYSNGNSVSNNQRYVKIYDKYVLKHEDGHSDEYVYGVSAITAMFTTTPGVNYTENWVLELDSINTWFDSTNSSSGDEHKGRFTKKSGASWNVTGPNGVPDGWTTHTA